MYTYHSGNEVSTTHPLLPSKRVYSGVVPRPAGIAAPSREHERKILGLSGGGQKGAALSEMRVSKSSSDLKPLLSSKSTVLKPLIFGKPRAPVVTTPTATAAAVTAIAAQTLSTASSPVRSFTFLPVDIQILSDSTIVAPWNKYFDTSIRKYFYIHTQTGEERWEHPVTPRQVSTSDTAVPDKSIPQGWSKYLDVPTDTYFYYDSNTTETTWDNPSPPPFPQGLTMLDSELPELYVKYSMPSSPENSFFFNTIKC
jgi:hypothetical protein